MICPFYPKMAISSYILLRLHTAPGKGKIYVRNSHLNGMHFLKVLLLGVQKPKKLKKVIGPKKIYEPLKFGGTFSIFYLLDTFIDNCLSK